MAVEEKGEVAALSLEEEAAVVLRVISTYPTEKRGQNSPHLLVLVPMMI